MKLCAIEPKELEEKILIRFAENQNDELLEDLSDYVINSQKEIERLNNIIKEVRNWVKSTIDIIEQQPTGNDDWILERLNSFISLLDKGE